jgi:hypothetical protein
MRRGFETNFFHLCPPEGWEAKAYMRNGFTARFCHFLGTIKICIKKNFFCVEKYVNSLRQKKNVIKKKRKNFFYVEKIE